MTVSANLPTELHKEKVIEILDHNPKARRVDASELPGKVGDPDNTILNSSNVAKVGGLAPERTLLPAGPGQSVAQGGVLWTSGYATPRLVRFVRPLRPEHSPRPSPPRPPLVSTLLAWW